jgi:uncharacterized SAM-dependent methyltransferase
MHDSKSLDNQILHGEKSLMFDEAIFVKQRIAENDKINIIDLGETSGTSALPFIYELLIDDSILGTYIPATVNKDVNRIAINNLRNYFLHSRIFDPNKTEFKTSSINRNFNLENAKDLMLDVNSEYAGQRFCNLFLLLNSALGNSEDPENMMRNIIQTMTDQDYLVVIQGIYSRSSETALIQDYTKWMSDPAGWYVMRDIASIFTDKPEFKVRWNEQKNGIQVFVETNKPSQALGVDIEEGKEVTLLRSARFTDEQLKQMFERVGFRIMNISYDDTMDNAMYFLKK